MGEILDRIKSLEDKVNEDNSKEKKKKFKFPFGKKVGKNQAKKNYVTVIIANENGTGQFLKEQIREQTVLVDGIPRIATPEYLIQYKKSPIMIIPSWSVQPINWKEQHQVSLTDGSNIAGYQLLLNRMKLSVVEGNKKKMKGWVAWIFGIVILGIIAWAFLSGGI